MFLGSSQVRSSATKLPSTFRTTNLGENNPERGSNRGFSPLGILQSINILEKKGVDRGGVSFSEKLKIPNWIETYVIYFFNKRKL